MEGILICPMEKYSDFIFLLGCPLNTTMLVFAIYERIGSIMRVPLDDILGLCSRAPQVTVS